MREAGGNRGEGATKQLGISRMQLYGHLPGSSDSKTSDRLMCSAIVSSPTLAVTACDESASSGPRASAPLDQQATVLEIVGPACFAALDSGLPGPSSPSHQSDDFHERDIPTVQTRRQLRARRHFEEVERDRAAARTDHRQAAAP